MKAQKLGLVLGMNMAVACLVMQGCKAVKQPKELPPPEMSTVDVPPPPPPATIETRPVAPDAGVRQEPPPAPTSVRSVGKLPPAPVAEPAKKPAPPPAVAGKPAVAEKTVHTVQRGEYLASISKKYNVKMSAIVAANPGLNPDRIRIGQKLNIPGKPAESAPKAGVMLASAPAASAASTTAPVKTKPSFKAYTGPTKDYVVKGGDSLGKIAYENGITIRALKELNGLKKDNVRVGQKLKIPAEKPVAEKPAAEKKAEKAAPAAKPAEAKAEAAAPVAGKKDEVKEAAPAAPAAPAEEPKAAAETAPAAPAEDAAPAAAEPDPAVKTYTVKEGDDLVSVAIMWGISPSQLLNANELKENEPLKPGTVLKLPPNAKQNVQ